MRVALRPAVHSPHGNPGVSFPNVADYVRPGLGANQRAAFPPSHDRLPWYRVCVNSPAVGT